MAADSETKAFAVGKWLLAAVIPLSALAIGSLHTTTLLVVTTLAAVSCILLWLTPPGSTSVASGWALGAFGVLLAATILQSVPLPSGMTAAIAPSNADIWARALSPLHEAGPTWHPLSVAPSATHVEVLKCALYGCVFLASVAVVMREGGARFLERVVIASASTIALVSLAHAAVDARSVFGIYSPRDVAAYEPGRLSPLLNHNHLAAYLNIGAALAVGTAIESRHRVTAAVLSAAAAMLLAGTSVWAASRGGTATLIVIVLLVSGLTLVSKRRRVGAAPVTLVSVLLLAAVLVGIGTSELARTDLADHDLSKLKLARAAIGLTRLSPVFGTGRGSFETVFPLVQETSTYYSFRAAENVVAQWFVEWGVPVSVSAAALFAMALRPSVVFGAGRPPVGAWIAVIGSFVHDLVDFHLEVPGVVVAVVVCFAVVVASRRATRVRTDCSGALRRMRMAGFACAGIGLVGVPLFSTDVGHTLGEERERLAKLATDLTAAQSFEPEIRAASLRYPAEPFLPLSGAVHAQVHGHVVLPWVARALERYPNFGRAHLVLARSLVQNHRAQARLEYRLAYAADALLRDRVVAEGLRLVDDFDSATDLVPEGVAGPVMLERLAGELRDRLPATSLRLDALLLVRDERALGPLRRRIAASTSDLRHRHVWCEGNRECVTSAMDAAHRLAALDLTRSCDAQIALARLRLAAGETNAALDDLARATETSSDRATCLRALVELSMEAGDRRRADNALDLALRSGCGTREECIQLYVWGARTADAHGNGVRAIMLYKRAAEVDPSADNYLESAATIAERMGLLSDAIESYDRLASRHSEDARFRKRAEELRARARSQAVSPLTTSGDPPRPSTGTPPGK